MSANSYNFFSYNMWQVGFPSLLFWLKLFVHFLGEWLALIAIAFALTLLGEVQGEMEMERYKRSWGYLRPFIRLIWGAEKRKIALFMQTCVARLLIH